MNRYSLTTLLGLVLGSVAGADDLAEYKTVATAVASRVSLAAPGKSEQPGYLGVRVAAADKGRLVVAEVQPDSPAAKAGLLINDVIAQLDGQPVARADVFRERLQTRSPSDAVKLGVVRGDKSVELTATLAAVSRPMKATGQQFVLGVQLGEPKDGGTPLDRIFPGSLAEKAGLKVGDTILKLEGNPFTGSSGLGDVLAAKKPGDTLALLLRRDGKEVEVKVELAATQGPRPGGFGGGLPAAPSIWKKDVLRVAVVGIDFPDVKHSSRITAKDWEESLFSKGTYAGKNNPTGQPVHGSLNDYFLEQSCGAFRVEGKVLDGIEVGKKRAEYAEGFGTGNKTALMAEAVEKVLARDKEALKNVDALFFVYAGEPVRTSNRGAVYYPHSGSVQLRSGQRWPYVLVPEGGVKMTSISGFVREFGQLLGLQDLAARLENAGSEGCGSWCLMSEPMGDGRPQHLCAWCKEQMGWLKPTVIDPTVKQKLILAPVEGSSTECFKVLVRPDGSEYFLLENRRRKGFDAGLPGEGLLIWRVVNGKPVLEESHGVEGAAGPQAFKELVPYPSPSNNAFTPHTTPSSRSPRGGGLPVAITEIRRLADGRITFHVGYEFQ